jgi:N-acyl-D-aspartate/D-glutamate deacylase
MRALVTDAIRAGAFGVSTSRFMSHRAGSGSLTPTILAREVELTGLMAGMADAGQGVFQLINESRDPEVLGEYEMIKRALARTGRPALFSLMSTAETPDQWRELLAFADTAIAEGVSMRPVVAPRGVGIMFGLEASKHPFSGTATYAEIADRPLAERVALMRDPEIRRRILGDDPLQYNTWDGMLRINYGNLYPLGDPPNYTPGPDDSVQAIALRQGRPPADVTYDALLENEGLAFLYAPTANYVGGNLSAAETMLANPNTVMGLGDGGAHVGFLLDAGFPTWLIKYWAVERARFSLAEVIRRLTADTANAIGLTDRGRIAVGLKADLNVLDIDEIGFGAPYAACDLPSGRKRLLQRGTGYRTTVVNGTVTYRDGVETGARPGRLVRSSATVQAGDAA